MAPRPWSSSGACCTRLAPRTPKSASTPHVQDSGGDAWYERRFYRNPGANCVTASLLPHVTCMPRTALPHTTLQASAQYLVCTLYSPSPLPQTRVRLHPESSHSIEALSSDPPATPTSWLSISLPTNSSKPGPSAQWHHSRSPPITGDLRNPATA
ncbi:hypothetical protein JB92DRAFT_1235924 [Gautieria morchelliformis]|nr:hypothetical protein JB92DRAFT_1235924 [Gautieria morchelliformis]